MASTILLLVRGSNRPSSAVQEESLLKDSACRCEHVAEGMAAGQVDPLGAYGAPRGCYGRWRVKVIGDLHTMGR